MGDWKPMRPVGERLGPLSVPEVPPEPEPIDYCPDCIEWRKDHDGTWRWFISCDYWRARPFAPTCTHAHHQDEVPIA